MWWDNVSIGPLGLPSIHSLFLGWCHPFLLFGNITPPLLLSVAASQMSGADHTLSIFCWPVTLTRLSEEPCIPAPPNPPDTVTGSAMALHSIRPTQLMPQLLLKGPGNGDSIGCWTICQDGESAALPDFTSPTKVCLTARSAWENPANSWTWPQWYRLRLEIQPCLSYSTLKANGSIC